MVSVTAVKSKHFLHNRIVTTLTSRASAAKQLEVWAKVKVVAVVTDDS